MRVKIREITSQGLEIVDQAMPRDLDLSEDFLDLDKPIIVRGHFERVDEFVLAKVKMTYTADTVCSRCLDPIQAEVEQELSLEFEFKPGDEFIDIGKRIREEILMGYTPRILCKEDCKGICTGCGVYLNNEECECDKPKKE